MFAQANLLSPSVAPAIQVHVPSLLFCEQYHHDCCCFIASPVYEEQKRKGKTTPFGVRVKRSLVTYWAAETQYAIAVVLMGYGWVWQQQERYHSTDASGASCTCAEASAIVTLSNPGMFVKVCAAAASSCTNESS